MITTNSKELNDICKSLRAHGWTRDLENSKIYKKKSDEFYENYRFILPGYNVRPQEINGAIGLEQLKKFDKMLRIREENAKLFQNIFKKDSRFKIQKQTGKSSWFAFTMIANPKRLKKHKYLNYLKKIE